MNGLKSKNIPKAYSCHVFISFIKTNTLQL